MIRTIILPVLTVLATGVPALAHPGHLGALAGHDHWVLGAGLGALAGAAAIAWVKGRRGKPEPDEDAAPEEDAPEGAPA